MKNPRPAAIRTAQSVINTRDEDEIEEEEEEEAIDNDFEVMNMFNALYEVQKKKGKSGSRLDFQKKKLEHYASARERSGAFVREALASMNEFKTSIEDLKSSEISVSKSYEGLLSLINHRDKCVRALLEEFPPIINELSPLRVQEINKASEDLDSFNQLRWDSRQRFFTNTQQVVEALVEQQKLATDATDLVRHYKALLRS